MQVQQVQLYILAYTHSAWHCSRHILLSSCSQLNRLIKNSYRPTLIWVNPPTNASSQPQRQSICYVRLLAAIRYSHATSVSRYRWHSASRFINFTNISRTVIVRWTHAARQFISIKFSFHWCNVLRNCPRGVPQGNKNVVKIAIFCTYAWT